MDPMGVLDPLHPMGVLGKEWAMHDSAVSGAVTTIHVANLLRVARLNRWSAGWLAVTLGCSSAIIALCDEDDELCRRWAAAHEAELAHLNERMTAATPEPIARATRAK